MPLNFINASRSMRILLPLFGLLVGSYATPSQAQGVLSSGVGTLTYTSDFFSSSPSRDQFEKVRDIAKLDAWRSYIASFSPAKMNQYEKVRTQIDGHLDTYLQSTRVVEERYDKTSRTLTVVVEVKVNSAAVDALLVRQSAAGQTASGTGSTFVFLFLARQAAESKDFDDKRVAISARESASAATEGLSSSQALPTINQSSSEMAKTTTGGSTERKSAKTTYRILSADNVDAAISEVLSSGGFEISNYDDVVSACGGVEREAIAPEFTQNDQMSNESRRRAFAGARQSPCDVKFFATGTLDVGMRDIDPVSGLKRVHVTVRAQVQDIALVLPKTVASVAPVTIAGLGPDEDVAMKNAIVRAAKDASRAILDQMNAKGLR